MTPDAQADADGTAMEAGLTVTEDGGAVVGPDSSVPPSEPFFLVFATSTPSTGAIGTTANNGIPLADAFCTQLADQSTALDGGIPGRRWAAWLSTAKVLNARDRIARDGGLPEYRLVDGTIFIPAGFVFGANPDAGAMVSNVPFVPINVDEKGLPSSGLAWTATSADGTYSGGGDCEAWSGVQGSSLVGVGDVAAHWTDGNSDSCMTPHRFYCFEVRN